MKKRCPCCSSSKAYDLADGRRKCRDCGHRYSWTSVWDSIRLPARAKARLLEMFVLMSPLHSARINGHDPYAYLKNVLKRLPTQPASRIDELLPHHWRPVVLAH